MRVGEGALGFLRFRGVSSWLGGIWCSPSLIIYLSIDLFINFSLSLPPHARMHVY